VAWSDEIFSDNPDPEKLQLLARVCQAVYSGGLALSIGSAISNPQQIAFHPLLNTWSFEVEGEKCVAIEGTTNEAQYASAANGYAEALPFVGGGFVNAFMAGQADLLWPVIPADVSVFAGHSLGGVVAQLLARRLHMAGGSVAGAVSFGSPRFVSPPANAAAGWPPIVNVVQQLDPVPLTPPTGTAGKSWLSPGQQWTLVGKGLLEPTSQLPVSNVTWSAFIANHGFAWHNTASYISSLQVPLPPAPMGFIAGGSGMPNYWRVDIKGLLMNQACDNGWWMIGFNDLVAADVVEDVRNVWINKILFRISPQYEVVHYEVGKLGGFVLQNPAAPVLVSLPRYTEFARRVGNAADKGGNSNVDPMPSFVSVSAPKACTGWKLADGFTEAPLRKRPRGRISFGGIPRLSTRPTSLGNRLTETEQDSWNAALNGAPNSLRVIHVNGHDYGMILLTQYGDIVPPATTRPVLFDDQDPPEPTFHVAMVTSLTPNTYVGSMVSRKQTISGRG